MGLGFGGVHSPNYFNPGLSRLSGSVPSVVFLLTAFLVFFSCRYISTVKQANASAAGAVVNCGMFVLAGCLILVSVYAVQAMGIGAFFTLLAGLQLLVATVAGACIARGFSAAKRQQEAATRLPVVSEGAAVMP